MLLKQAEKVDDESDDPTGDEAPGTLEAEDGDGVRLAIVVNKHAPFIIILPYYIRLTNSLPDFINHCKVI